MSQHASMADPEKDYSSTSSHTSSTRAPLADVYEKKLLRKIDLHVLPYICVMYLFAFLDRVNISNAAIFGIQKELHMTGLQFNTAIVIFFVPYIVFEIPSNLMLKRLKPHVWLSGCMFLFGLVTMLQGFVKSYAGLLVTRFFLGTCEAGMFPGCFYLLAMWYRREESQKRFTFFFNSTTLAGAFGGLIAAGIGKMDGVQGFKGWRWVFILEGIATCVFAMVGFFLLADFPEEAKFLSADERIYVKDRLQQDVGSSAYHSRIGFKDVIDTFKDYKVFLGGLMYMAMLQASYSYSLFAPSIIKGFGYDNIQSQLHSVPPWACAFVFSMVLAYFSDRLRHRWLFSVFPAVLSITGYAILTTYPKSLNVKYGSLFLAATGAFSSMPVLVGWFNTNLAGHKRRAIGSGFQVAFGNVAAIIASFSFPTEDAPQYATGFRLATAFACLSVVASTAYFIGCLFENRRRDRLQREQTGVVEQSKEEEEKLGDLSLDYRYML